MVDCEYSRTAAVVESGSLCLKACCPPPCPPETKNPLNNYGLRRSITVVRWVLVNPLAKLESAHCHVGRARRTCSTRQAAGATLYRTRSGAVARRRSQSGEGAGSN